ncbi:MAG: hypothetical protein HFK09_04510 [Clostridia bacterium]|nr:hypothetical protein [Clostridia bacterium]
MFRILFFSYGHTLSMKCAKCGKEIIPEEAYRCGDCGRDYCAVCAETSGICDCHGDFTLYN